MVLLAGPHEDERADLDVYTMLYEALGLAEHPAGDATHRQGCCDDAARPPVDDELLDRFLAGARALRRERRRAYARRRRRR